MTPDEHLASSSLPVAVPFRRRTSATMVALCGALASLGVAMIVGAGARPADFGDLDLRGEGQRLVGAACAAFFGMGVVLFLMPLVRSNPALVLDDEGLVVRTSPIGVVRLRWTEIAGATRRDPGGDVVDIELVDVETHVRDLPFAARFLARLRLLLNRSPVLILGNVIAASSVPLAARITAEAARRRA